MGMRSPAYSFYKNKDEKEMPLDTLKGSMFESKNPYSDPALEGFSSGSIMPTEDLLKQAISPEVDFKKETLEEQVAPKSDAGTLLDKGSESLILFGDPQMKALGLGLQAAGAIAQNAEQQRQNKYKAEVARVKARQDALNRMAQIGQGLKVV